ncbi:hypothetical protein BUQ74_15845 [Leptospira weilii serovar Heyan]|nr:hypothetical protein BUQ74_15845 [Leptospira weilii serovar Heyan]
MFHNYSLKVNKLPTNVKKPNLKVKKFRNHKQMQSETNSKTVGSSTKYKELTRLFRDESGETTTFPKIYFLSR